MASKRKTATTGAGDPVSCTMEIHHMNFGSLGKRIEIGARSKVSVNHPEFGIKYHRPSICLTIGIGKNHVAHLVMDVQAWEALKADEKIDITTLSDFKKNFL